MAQNAGDTQNSTDTVTTQWTRRSHRTSQTQTELDLGYVDDGMRRQHDGQSAQHAQLERRPAAIYVATEVEGDVTGVTVDWSDDKQSTGMAGAT